MRLWNCNEDEILSIFGAFSKNQHWISEKEMKFLDFNSA